MIMTNRLLFLLLLLLALPCSAAEPGDLSDAGTDELVAALTDTNAATRQAAARLLVSKNDSRTEEALRPLINSMSFRGFDEAKGETLRILHRLGKLPPELLAEAIATDGKPTLQTNALHLAAEIAGSSRPAIDTPALRAAILKRLRNSSPSVRPSALHALGAFPVTEAERAVVVDLYPEFTTLEMQSAALAIAAKAPAAFIDAAASSSASGLLTNFIAQIASRLPPPAAAQALIVLAAKPDTADSLKRTALDTFLKQQKPDAAPPWSDELASAFRALFESPSAVSASALPLAARWDKEGSLRADAKKLITSLLEKVKEDFRPEETRAQFVASLLTVRQLDPNILPAVGKLLDGSDAPALQRKVIEGLGATAEPAAGRLLTQALTNLPPALHDTAFTQILARTDWSLALLEAFHSGELKPALLPKPVRQRLRKHSDKSVSSRAAEVLNSLPEAEPKEKAAPDKEEPKEDKPKKSTTGS